MDTDKIIKDQYETLSPALKQALQIVPWKDIVRKIAEDNDLNSASKEALETETMLVLYCFESADDFLQNVTAEVGIDALKTKMVVSKVVDLIFTPILDKIEELGGIDAASSPTEKPQVVPAPAPSPIIDLSKELELEAPKPEHLIQASTNTAHTTPVQAEDTPQKETLVQTPRYTGGLDPYREETS